VLRSNGSDCDEDGWLDGDDGAVCDGGIGSVGGIGMDVDGISGEGIGANGGGGGMSNVVGDGWLTSGCDGDGDWE